MITIRVMDVHRISIEPAADEWRQAGPRGAERADQRASDVCHCVVRETAAMCLLSVARRHTHTHVNFKDSYRSCRPCAFSKNNPLFKPMDQSKPGQYAMKTHIIGVGSDAIIGRQ